MRQTWFCLVGLSLVLAIAIGNPLVLKQVTATNSYQSPQSDSQDRWRPDYGPFELNVLVNGRRVEEYYSRGRIYIEAIRGTEYELEVRNPLAERVAVALSVDGLNSIDARHTSAWNASKWVIEPYGTIRIGGWQVSSERARRFYFTDERDSYASKLGQTANIGVISAVFFRERYRYPIPITPPSTSRRDESNQRPSKSPSSAGAAESGRESKSRGAVAPPIDDDYAATGIGRSVRNDVRWIDMLLDSQSVAEITIRYEYYSALRRLGVVPRPYPEPDPIRRREQSRGFSPEPF
jgi:hypothetical protein